MVRLYPGLVVRGAYTPDLDPSCDGGEPGGVGGEAATRSALATPERRVAPIYIVYMHGTIAPRPQAKISAVLSL